MKRYSFKDIASNEDKEGLFVLYEDAVKRADEILKKHQDQAVYQLAMLRQKHEMELEGRRKEVKGLTMKAARNFRQGYSEAKDEVLLLEEIIKSLKKKNGCWCQKKDGNHTKGCFLAKELFDEKIVIESF